jgi:hypothetical protein
VRRAARRLAAGALVRGALAGTVLAGLGACSRSAPVAAGPPIPAATTTTPVGSGPMPTESVITGSVPPTPTATPLRITDEQAAQLLLTPADLPADYQVDPYVSPDTRVGLPPGCPVLDAFGTVLTSAPLRAARGFAGGEVGPLIEERVAVLPGRAPDLMGQLARAGSACRRFDSRDPDGGVVRFTATPLAFTAPGVEVLGLSLAGRPTRGDLVVTQAVALRRGDVIVLFVHSGPDQNGPDQNGPDQNGADQNGSNQSGPDQNGPNQSRPPDQPGVAVLQAGLDRAAHTLDRF